MCDPKVKEEGKEEEDQPQDLAHQKPEETNNLNKSERPSDDYLDSRGLDHDTLGKKEDD